MSDERAALKAYVDALREEVLQAEHRREPAAVETVRRLAADIADAAHPIAHWGDGNGGAVVNIIVNVLRDEGIVSDESPSVRAPTSRKRKAISRTVEREVFARYGYACDDCGVSGTEAPLTIDHIYPHSLGGRDDAENLRPLCRSCNSRKGARVRE